MARQTDRTPHHPTLAAALLGVALLTGTLAHPFTAQAQEVEATEYDRTDERLPEARVTTHELALPDRTLAFTAKAGAVALSDASGDPEAEIAYVAYTLDADDAGTRPVTFALNGGPGAASAYLHIGVLGPWLLPMDSETIVPSQDAGLEPNAETWLDFTDLVFVDPVGTGFSRLIESTDRKRDRYLSVDGDIDALAEFVRRWLIENDRLAAPRYFIGESYGGFRGPLLAEALQTDQGLALDGMILLSPVLDFGWWAQPDHAPLPYVSVLPSLAAAAQEKQEAFSEDALRAAERYASGEYVTDFLRGFTDDTATARMVARVTELTGLDQTLVERAGGRVGRNLFAREILRDEGRLASPYDTTISAIDPFPGDAYPYASDAVLDGMTAPLISAMLMHYSDTLEWLPDRRYQLLNDGVNRAWDWDSGRGQPEAISALSRMLALDPAFRMLVVHGYTDLVTPYYASELILRQLPAGVAGNRVRTENYRGGHMFYTRLGSRRAFREDAKGLYAPEPW